ncbi:MAG: polysaccharide deacetylase family protein [Verrucomicrobiota bacterium]
MHRNAVVLLVVMAMSWSGCKPTAEKNPMAAEVQSSPPPIAEQVRENPGEAQPVQSPTPAPINKNAQVIVLGYHRIVEKVRRPDTEITPADFEAQMQELKDQGLEVIPMQDLIAWQHGQKSIPDKSAVITFDDGWKQQYTIAWPILKKYSYPFTLFIYTDYVKGGPKSGGESISWDQLAEMRDAGADIQGHTISHHDLRGGKRGKAPAPDYEAWLWNELNGSKQIIEQHLGNKVNVLALPYGFYNQHVQEVAKKAGYDAIFTVYGQKIGFSSPPNALGRYMIQANQPKVFADAVRFGGGAARENPAPVAEVTSQTLSAQPPDGAIVTDPRPVIKASIANLGPVDSKTLVMRISSLGPVPAKYDPKTKMLSYRPETKLKDGLYTVIISGMAAGKKIETRWGFAIDVHAGGRAGL